MGTKIKILNQKKQKATKWKNRLNIEIKTVTHKIKINRIEIVTDKNNHVSISINKFFKYNIGLIQIFLIYTIISLRIWRAMLWIQIKFGSFFTSLAFVLVIPVPNTKNDFFFRCLLSLSGTFCECNIVLVLVFEYDFGLLLSGGDVCVFWFYLSSLSFLGGGGSVMCGLGPILLN